MAFESLTDKLQNVFKKLRGKGRLTEEDVKIALKEVKMALLEADVNFKVVKKFVKAVEERAIGSDVMNGLNPGQMVIKIVNEEMTALMGSPSIFDRITPSTPTFSSNSEATLTASCPVIASTTSRLWCTSTFSLILCSSAIISSST